MANWQRSKHARSRQHQPKPISPLARGREQTIGNTTGRDPEEVKALLLKYKTGAFDVGG